MILFVILTLILIHGLVGMAIMQHKGRSAAVGFIVASLLGFVGWIILSFVSNNRWA